VANGKSIPGAPPRWLACHCRHWQGHSHDPKRSKRWGGLVPKP